MLKGSLIHPEILFEVAKCGHGDKILITDGNYPKYEKKHEAARLIDLALSENIPSVIEVLKALTSVVNVEKYELMDPGDHEELPALFTEFSEILIDIENEKLGRFEFYQKAVEKEVRLVIGSAETRVFGNILLTVGVR
ncbi:RbsD/FucU family protein [Enterococcus pallens]|uniref:Uncharacterized protein n=1 Tax=Enterococcus pallens ATCC BAA-351 TaxID=1158607 RepID=R2QK47_9ENTE|nr:RbsD/FucU family protein [Enterococcus pallens]EOH95558.1 hypothetical protein UAU_01520 [Enterococcus pallens ATCC BAA-351]EOU21305.1 hypothetical protein I588_02152 [Enterococcus pallens ATCC BAA-351]OJG78806.1 hypothetical protein RV10_GL001292 [Enterococcus pallens]